MAKKVAQNKYWLFLFKEFRLIKLIFLSLASYLVLKAFYAFVIVKPTYTSNAKRNLVPEDLFSVRMNLLTWILLNRKAMVGCGIIFPVT